jgi:threonine/homoserine/homoserine lactone efflux protein
VISLASLGLFTLFAFGLILIPGADTALVIRIGLQRGARNGLMAGIGICAGLFFWGATSTLGLAALLLDDRIAAALKWIGAAYLIYLGVNTWRTRSQSFTTAPRRGSLFATGFLVNLLNPKVAVFYLTVLPHFITAGPNVLLQGLLLAGIHALLSLLWFAFLMGALDRFTTRLLTPQWRDRIALASGSALVVFGIGLALQ